MSNSCRVDSRGIAAITPSVSALFLSAVFVCGPLMSGHSKPDVQSKVYLRSWCWMWCHEFTSQRGHGRRRMDRCLAINWLDFGVLQRTCKRWAVTAVPKALHHAEGAAWHKCQWGHSPCDWQEKIRDWCWGLGAPAAVGNLLQRTVLAACLKSSLEADETYSSRIYHWL